MVFASSLLVLSLWIPGGQELPASGIVPPRVVKAVKADYTKEARDAHIEGTVVVEVLVSTDGMPTNVRVVESLDSKYGLDLEAIRVSRLWRFAPATRRGQPIEQAIRLEHAFRLGR